MEDAVVTFAEESEESSAKCQDNGIAFFDAEGLMHNEFLPQCQTMNQTCLHNRSATPSRCRSSETASQMVFGTWLLHHDNAPCLAALSVREFLTKHSIPVVPHPPYLSDLALCDFFLFPRLKNTLKGKRFQDVAEIQLNTTRQLQAIPKQAYQKYTEKWKDR
jgi:hypothetical protein